jgi:predicted DNA-binding transcriptional regulator AlpA
MLTTTTTDAPVLFSGPSKDESTTETTNTGSDPLGMATNVNVQDPTKCSGRRRGSRLAVKAKRSPELAEEEKKERRALARQRRKERLAKIDLDSLPDILNVDEVAALLRVDAKTVREQFYQGIIPGGRRIGAKIVRFSRSVVLAWFEGQGCVSRSSRRKPG